VDLLLVGLLLVHFLLLADFLHLLLLLLVVLLHLLLVVLLHLRLLLEPQVSLHHLHHHLLVVDHQGQE
jgi:hypothetical protein